jgi:hypothetical protein
VDTPKGTQIRTERGACSLAAVAMDLTLPITIVIPRPFAHRVGNRGMARMTTPITLPFICVEERVPGGDGVGNKVAAGVLVRMVTDPPALLTRVARDDTDDGRAIVRIRPVPLAFVGAAPGWICRVRVRRAFFPRRFGTIRRPRRPSHALHQSGRSRLDALEYAAARCGAVSVTPPIRGQGAP